MLSKFSCLILIILLFSCKQDRASTTDERDVQIAPSSIDDVLADSLIVFFKSDYLKDDMQFLSRDTTSFQFYKIDLNGDAINEIFIRFMGPYFCGNDGCSYIILDRDFNLLNKFTSTRAPIMVASIDESKWKVLLTGVEDEVKMLINKNDRYPSNPNMAPTSTIPESDAELRIFDDATNPSKTYSF